MRMMVARMRWWQRDGEQGTDSAFTLEMELRGLTDGQM